MGTKRAFDEELQEFVKHPKHLDYGSRHALFAENKLSPRALEVVGIAGEGGGKYFHTGDGPESENVITIPDMVGKEFESSAPLPLVTGISTTGDDAAPGPVFCSNFFPEFFEFNLPRRQLFHYDHTFSSLLNSSPRKQIPIGPDHQADILEFESDLARNRSLNNHKTFANGGVCVIPMSNSDYSTEDGEAADNKTNCKCPDGGSVRCVQQHVKEGRLKLRGPLGHEKYVELGMFEMGEEVACRWTEEEERLFHEVVYSNPLSLGKKFWEQLAIAFPSLTKKELVSYYFNVFILRRRAVQNRSNFLEIDSDDDEWRGGEGRFITVRVEDEDFVVGGSSLNHDSSSEDGDIVIGVRDDSRTFEGQHSELDFSKKVDEKSIAMDYNVKSGDEQEKPYHESRNSELRSEYGFQPCDGKLWDPPYSSMNATKGADLLPTCSMIQEIFGSSEIDKSTIQ